MTNETPDMPELLPCPFCLSPAKINSHVSCDCCGKPYNGCITCTKCPAYMDHFDTDYDAIKAWNTRPTPPADAQRALETMEGQFKTIVIPTLKKLDRIGTSVEYDMAMKSIQIINVAFVKVKSALSASSREKELMECIRDLNTAIQHTGQKHPYQKKHAALIAEARGEK